ncbi:MAG: glycosyltransferase family 2 protein [Deltaproteobacteria bacterium]|nr:glycosyltransferase family 2 protein [Deltaproteobacteria bacterium]
MKISVIIPTRNRTDDLIKVLPSYLAESSVLEIIVVDDSTLEPHIKKIRDVARMDPRLVLAPSASPRGLPAARNRGIRQAKGEFIFFGEDDLELAPGHFSILLSHLKETGADIIQGRKIWKKLGESNERAFERAKNFKGPLWNSFYMECDSEQTPSCDMPAPLLLAHFLAKKEIFQKVLFEENYEGFVRGYPWREETDFLMKAGEMDFCAFFCPHTVCFQAFVGGGGTHEHSFWREQYWILKNHHFLLQRHRSFILEKLRNRWPPFLLLLAYALHRFNGQLRSRISKLF